MTISLGIVKKSYIKLGNHMGILFQRGFLGGASGKEPPLPMQETQETWVQSLSQEDPLEEVMETHSSILARRIPWTEEPGGLQSIGSRSRA